MLLYIVEKMTHAVFTSERQGRGYSGAFDVVKLEPGDYSSGYPEGNFIGNRKTFEEAKEWAERCAALPRFRVGFVVDMLLTDGCEVKGEIVDVIGTTYTIDPGHALCEIIVEDSEIAEVRRYFPRIMH